jgi:uncharacterized protein YebE (UPF0316 family)
MISIFESFDVTSWVIIPLLIFVARLIDVTLATMRHILVYRGSRRLVPLLGFIEVLVWLVAMTQVLNNLTNVVSYLAWAAGFSVGTWCGMVIEEKLALGHQLVRIVSGGDCAELTDELRNDGYGVTVVPGQGASGPVEIIFVATTRTKATQLASTIRRYDPKLFYTVEDVRSVTEGVFARKASKTVTAT